MYFTILCFTVIVKWNRKINIIHIIILTRKLIENDLLKMIVQQMEIKNFIYLKIFQFFFF